MMGAVFGQLAIAIAGIMAAIFGWFGWLATTNALFIASMSQISFRQGLGGQLHCRRWVDVQELKWENPGAICLALNDGKSVTLNMFLLSHVFHPYYYRVLLL